MKTETHISKKRLKEIVFEFNGEFSIEEQNHLAQCAKCKKEYQQLLSTSNLLYSFYNKKQIPESIESQLTDNILSYIEKEEMENQYKITLFDRIKDQLLNIKILRVVKPAFATLIFTVIITSLLYSVNFIMNSTESLRLAAVTPEYYSENIVQSVNNQSEASDSLQEGHYIDVYLENILYEESYLEESYLETFGYWKNDLE